MAVRMLADRWPRIARSIPGIERGQSGEMARMAKSHSSEGFCAFDNAIESALFSICIEMLKTSDGPAGEKEETAAENTEGGATSDVDP
jgi:hypothetical protein